MNSIHDWRMKYRVINDFLDEEYFDSLVTLFTDIKNEKNVPWYFQSNVVFPKGEKKWETELETEEKNELFYMAHLFYEKHRPNSEHYDIIIPLLEKLEVRCLIRIKANLFPNTEILHEHPMHADYDYSHKAALLSLNTCDGYTKLEDGTKIYSVANRILLFDASRNHCSTTTTNVSARFNININYIQVQEKK